MRLKMLLGETINMAGGERVKHPLVCDLRPVGQAEGLCLLGLFHDLGERAWAGYVMVLETAVVGT